jgi:hypothetical protein
MRMLGEALDGAGIERRRDFGGGGGCCHGSHDGR